MATIKKGQTLECDPCGREVTVSKEGVSPITVYCCGLPMRKNKDQYNKETLEKTIAKKKTIKSR